MEGDGEARELDPNERKMKLGQAVQAEVVQGGVIESQSDFTAVIRYGKPINHVLHLILTLVTCGLWGIVWIILWIVSIQEKKSIALQINEFGQVFRQEIRAR
ncbi:hypothetical protein HNR06_001014 [Nocardiopsis arvandica]|uniref:Uncharacterized protein n=1 Tax=Nocardiopsis sinuspersici TaxID=501010 RepID=A0A7Y9XBV2_9ACTN|nr:DUF4234 domain-containing protein [Nocardiopsis sinuspersici]NYH51425.1 hypothetical protein [Nocardiopsis sinuspersici]